MSKEQINLVVRRHLFEIKCCYDAGRTEQPDLSGSVVVGWKVEATGEVSRLWVVENTLPSEPAIACIGERICDWTFPGSAAPTTIGRYPFVFKSGPDAPPAVPR